MKTLCLLALAFLIADCGKSKPPPPRPTPIPTATPTPEPSPTATPTVEPSPSPEPTPSPVTSPSPSSTPTPVPIPTVTPAPTPDFPVPYPTPTYNPGSYVNRGDWPVVVVRAKPGEDLAELINEAQAGSPRGVTIRIEGGGSIKNQVRLRTHTVFDSSTYSCDTKGAYEVTPGDTNNSLWYGCFLVDDGVLVEGTYRPPPELDTFFKNRTWANLEKVQALTDAQLAGTGTTILEPAFSVDRKPFPIPSITIFQAYQDAVSVQHDRESRGISIIGFHVVGRQPFYDGGVRPTMTFGNCVNCSAQYNYLDNTRSIGIQFGGFGGGVGTDPGTRHWANNFLAYRNITSRLPSANIAVVNGENGIIAESYSLRFGHVGFAAGITAVDVETNDAEDHARNLWIMNNLYDFEGSIQNGTGNGMNLQGAGMQTEAGPAWAVNNVIIGGRNDGVHRYMTNGILVAYINHFTVASNYIYKTAQMAVQVYGCDPKRENSLSCSITNNGKGGTIQGNWFDATGGGGNPTIYFINAVGPITVGPNSYTLKPGTKFGTDFRIQGCASTGITLTENRLDGELLKLTGEGCPKQAER